MINKNIRKVYIEDRNLIKNLFKNWRLRDLLVHSYLVNILTEIFCYIRHKPFPNVFETYILGLIVKVDIFVR